jgi:hypothetical protein
MKPDVAHAFQGCSGMAPAPLEPVRLQHLQGSAQSEEPICQSTPSSTIHKSCGASQNLATTFGAIWNSSTAGSQLSALTMHGYASKAPFISAMPRTNNSSVTWRGLNFFTVQTFHSVQFDPQASRK